MSASPRITALDERATLISDVTEKDRAILRILTTFVLWAGRYPDPGSGRESTLEDIFTISEQFQIAARDVFGLSTRVMQRIGSEIG